MSSQCFCDSLWQFYQETSLHAKVKVHRSTLWNLHFRYQPRCLTTKPQHCLHYAHYNTPFIRWVSLYTDYLSNKFVPEKHGFGKVLMKLAKSSSAVHKSTVLHFDRNATLRARERKWKWVTLWNHSTQLFSISPIQSCDSTRRKMYRGRKWRSCLMAHLIYLWCQEEGQRHGCSSGFPCPPLPPCCELLHKCEAGVSV